MAWCLTLVKWIMIMKDGIWLLLRYAVMLLPAWQRVIMWITSLQCRQAGAFQVRSLWKRPRIGWQIWNYVLHGVSMVTILLIMRLPIQNTWLVWRMQATTWTVMERLWLPVVTKWGLPIPIWSGRVQDNSILVWTPLSWMDVWVLLSIILIRRQVICL